MVSCIGLWGTHVLHHTPFHAWQANVLRDDVVIMVRCVVLWGTHVLHHTPFHSQQKNGKWKNGKMEKWWEKQHNPFITDQISKWAMTKMTNDWTFFCWQCTGCWSCGRQWHPYGTQSCTRRRLHPHPLPLTYTPAPSHSFQLQQPTGWSCWHFSCLRCAKQLMVDGWHTRCRQSFGSDHTSCHVFAGGAAFKHTAECVQAFRQSGQLHHLVENDHQSTSMHRHEVSVKSWTDGCIARTTQR